MDDREIWRLRLAVPQWLKDNPGLAITALYVGASLIGLIYVFQFFRRFRINVLEFTEGSDFLMVVVREPLTVALALGGIVFYVIYNTVMFALRDWAIRRWPRLAPDPAKHAKMQARARRTAPYIQLAFIFVYAVLFTLLYSAYQARRVRAGEYPQVTIQYKGEAWASAAPVTATFLGSNSRFLFVYHASTRTADAIPFDSIARLTWDARSRKERAEQPKDSNPTVPDRK